jgi:hypothetical protein
MTGWTPEHDAELRANIEAGLPLSYAEMASVLNEKFGTNYTRNSTIGRAHRLGLAMARPKKVPKTGPKRATTPAQRPDVAIRKAARPSKPPGPFIPRTVDVHTENVTLLDLAHDGCRWPTSETTVHLFCNAACVKDRPYCGSHLRLSIGEPTARRVQGFWPKLTGET